MLVEFIVKIDSTVEVVILTGSAKVKLSPWAEPTALKVTAPVVETTPLTYLVLVFF